MEPEFSSQQRPLIEGCRLAGDLAAMIDQIPHGSIPDRESLACFRYANAGVVIDVALGGNPVEEPLPFMPGDRLGRKTGGKMDHFLPRHFKQLLCGAVGVEENRIRRVVMGQDDGRSVVQDISCIIPVQLGQERMSKQALVGAENE